MTSSFRFLVGDFVNALGQPGTMFPPNLPLIFSDRAYTEDHEISPESGECPLSTRIYCLSSAPLTEPCKFGKSRTNRVQCKSHQCHMWRASRLSASTPRLFSKLGKYEASLSPFST